MTEKYIKKQQAKLTSGFIDRRQFMVSVLATGIAMPTALSLATQAMAAMPKKGGVLRHATGYGSTDDSLDPGTSANSLSQNVIYTRGNHLTEVSKEGELVGELAESFEASNNAKTWMFNLRKGVEFHNGKSLTADDVIATMEYHGSENSKSSAKGNLSSIKSIKKDGNHRVVFELEEGNADFPYLASDYHIMINASKDGKIDPLDPANGTGAYMVEKYEPGVKFVGKRNPNYFKEGHGNFDEVQLIAVLDAAARQSAIMSGDADFADAIPAKTVNLLGRAPNLTILETTGTQHYIFPMRLDTAPFDNYNVRKALKYAVNRQELLDKILLGHGVVGNDIPVSAAMPFLNTELPNYEFDPEKAAMYYKKSGHSGPISLSVAEAGFAGGVSAGELMVESAKQCGIDIQLVREPNDGYWSNVWNVKGWCNSYWGGRPTQDVMYQAAYTKETNWNETAWKDTEAAVTFNELVIMARSETNNDKRKRLYWDAQALLHDDGGALIPLWANYIHAHAKTLEHGPVAGNWINDGNKVSERWWFA
jgi:peptide/nickel transport system substrate-binding protein